MTVLTGHALVASVIQSLSDLPGGKDKAIDKHKAHTTKQHFLSEPTTFASI